MAISILLLGAILLTVWIRSATWQRIAQLEHEFAAIESERFLLGIHAREAMVQMNGALLRFQLSGDLEERDLFLRTGRDIAERLARTTPELHTEAERAAAAAFRSAYDQYRVETADMIEKSIRGIRKDTAAQVHDLIQAKSREVIRLANDLAAAQAVAWTDFVSGSRDALKSLRQMLWLSLLALLAFAALAAFLLYRVVVTPLHARLTLSEKAMERHEKLASLGTLAAGVAHEIRNPLQAIKMRLFSLKKTLPPAAQDDEDLAVISSEINRLEKIVKDTLDFARPANPEMAAVSVPRLLGEVSQLLGRAMPPEIKLRLDIHEEQSGQPLSILGDRQQLQQVIINLVQNAIESIEGQGTVTIAARAGVGRLNGERAPVVFLEVSDTGVGIPAEAQRRIFDPFFSTRDGGTGLGLAIAARIVEAHGGSIQFSTRANVGTTFTLMLPQDTEQQRS